MNGLLSHPLHSLNGTLRNCRIFYQNQIKMKFRLLSIALVAVVFWGCGSSSKVTTTGTQEKQVETPEVKGSETSTGLCKTFTNEDEKSEVLAAYSLYRESFKQKNYEDAMENWNKLMEMAPGFRKKPFVDGEVMYKHYYLSLIHI